MFLLQFQLFIGVPNSLFDEYFGLLLDLLVGRPTNCDLPPSQGTDLFGGAFSEDELDALIFGKFFEFFL